MTHDSRLAAIAQYHSEDMAATGYAGHRSPGGETVGDRFAAFGYDCAVSGEVVQYVRSDRPTQTDGGSVGYETDDELAREIVANWDRSDRHAAFLRNESWTAHGVGIAVDDDGTVYVTQNTCTTDRPNAD